MMTSNSFLDSRQRQRRDDIDYRQRMLMERINNDAEVIARMKAGGKADKALLVTAEMFEEIAAIASDIAAERRQVGY